MWAPDGSRSYQCAFDHVGILGLSLSDRSTFLYVMAPFHPMSPTRSLALMICKTGVLAITTQCSWVHKP